MDILNKIQVELNAPKNRFNSFGKYKYRNCEDILMGVKPLLKETGTTLVLTDDIVMHGNRFYLKATATLSLDGKVLGFSNGLAREPENKKGMDEGQITGTASSYARKYALNGLFAIDDTKDADSDEHHNEVNNRPEKKVDPKSLFNDTSDKIVRQYIGSGKMLDNQRADLIKELDSGKLIACPNLVDALIKEYGALNA